VSDAERTDSGDAPNWVATVGDLWMVNVGAIAYGRVGRDLGPIVRLYGLEAAKAAVLNFAKHRQLAIRQGVERPDGWAQFLRDFRDYVPRTMLPPGAVQV
jgi:hypothetical protein